MELSRAAAAAAVCLALSALAALWTGSDPGYAHDWAVYSLRSPFEILWGNVVIYNRALMGFWSNGYVGALTVAVHASVLALAALGIRGRLKSAGPPETFFALYLLLLLVFPGPDGMRYLLPVLPLMLFYAALGLEHAAGRLKRASARLAAPAACALLLVSYAGAYSRMDWGPKREGVSRTETIELMEFLRRSTTASDLIVFRRPRVVALYAGRRAALYVSTRDHSLQTSVLEGLGATFVVVGRPFRDDQLYLRPWIEARPRAFRRVYRNADFEVFKIVRPSDGS